MFTSTLFSALASIGLLLVNTAHVTAASLQHTWGNLTVSALFAPPGGPGTNSIGIGDPEDLPTSSSTGTPPRWQGNAGGTNTKLGNKLTTIPIVGWTARGGLPVQFTLYHNSFSPQNRELGAKWSHSYLLYLVVDSQTGNVTVHWGDERCHTYTRQPDGSYTPPTAIFDTLVANGNEVSITYPNGVTTSKSYDAANRLTSLVHRRSDNTVIASYNYSYNADGLRTQVVEADGSTVSYTYDGAHRLVGEVRTGTAPYSISYVLDAEGNRLSQTVNGVTTTFSYNADDQLLSTSGGFNNSYTYNANGEQVSWTLNGVTYTLSWDYDGQLVGISGNGSTVSFAYDALGRRVSRTINGTTTQFLHDGDIIALELQGGSVTAVYRYGNSLLARNGEVVLADGLGTTRATVDSTQAVTSTFTTEAFGNPVAQWGNSANPYRFAGAWGYRDDGDVGLLHVGARYYDPQVGRFISRDAVRSEHSFARSRALYARLRLRKVLLQMFTQ